jgi:hypothetical protein
MAQHYEVRIGDQRLVDAATRERAEERKRELLEVAGLREDDLRIAEQEGVLPAVEREVEAER